MKKTFVSLLAGVLGGIFVVLANNYLTTGHFSFSREEKTQNISFVRDSNPGTLNANFHRVANFNFDENSFINAADKTVHSVVHVKNMTVAPQINSIFDLLYGNYDPNGKGEERLAGTGSGVIISPDGYIVTNNHVIENASSVEVTLNNNKTYKADIVGSDPSSDIALLKIKADEKLSYLTFADSDNTKVGEWVLAVGNPFNLTSTVTAGIISAKARNLNGNYSDRVDSFIQTDAAVNSGNSGGALVNLNGDLIGINTAITSTSGTFVGYSFAVPSNIAKKVVEDLIEYGNVQKGVLGVRGTDLNSETAAKINVKETEGFYIGAVEEESGAEEAGLKQGDIIKEMDGIKVRSFADLNGHINTKRPGDKVYMKVLRGGSLKDFSVRLKKNATYRISSLGMEVKELSQKDKRAFNTTKGVKISLASEYYASNGINMKDKVLLSINGEEIDNIDHLKKILAKNANKRSVLVLLNSKGERERVII